MTRQTPPSSRPSRRKTLARGAMLLLAAAACVNLAAGAVLAVGDPARAVDLWSMYDWCRGWLLSGERLFTGADATTDYPPNAIVLLSPLALLPRHWLVPLWTAVSLALAPALAFLVIRCGDRRDWRRALVPVLLFLCWTSTRTLLQFSALSMTLAFAALLLADTRWVASGVLLGLSLFKPHVAGPIALHLALTGRARVAAVAGAVVAAGWGAYDVRVTERPLTTLGGYWHVLGEQYGGLDGLMGKTSIRAWTRAAIDDPGAADAWWIGLSVLLLAAAVWLVRRGPPRPSGADALAGPALLALWSLLAVYHNTNNLILMLPAWAYLWPRDAGLTSLRRWLPLVLLQAVLTFDVPTRLAGIAPPRGWLRVAVDDFDRLVVLASFAYVALVWYRATRRPTPE